MKTTKDRNRMNDFKQFFNNLRFFLFSRKAQKRISALQDSVKVLNYELSLIQCKISDEEDIRLAYEYLRKRPLCTDVFPYEKTRSLGTIDLRYDNESKMHYVMHNGRPLYFPNQMTENRIREIYRIAIEDEDIIGYGYRQRNPHAYQSERYHIEEGDILIDAGSAEGLLALDVIDKVSKAYLVECDSRWWRPLEATFAPYKHKVEIVKRALSSTKSNETIGLSDLLTLCGTKNVFVKMDIEGAEIDVLRGAQEHLKLAKKKNILAVCAYHRTTDYSNIMSFFETIGYNTENQSGYMYTNMNDGHGIYSLRKGIIRASNV